MQKNTANTAFSLKKQQLKPKSSPPPYKSLTFEEQILRKAEGFISKRENNTKNKFHTIRERIDSDAVRENISIKCHVNS